jgi:selenide,water dikinase
MRQFNQTPITVAGDFHGSIHACTDVTGFGLAGHASEVASASGTSIEIDTRALPVITGAERLAIENLPCGGRANAKHFKKLVVEADVDLARHLLCLDPQTSGGLLFAVEERQADTFVGRLHDAGVSAASVGRVVARDPAGTLVTLR